MTAFVASELSSILQHRKCQHESFGTTLVRTKWTMRINTGKRGLAVQRIIGRQAVSNNIKIVGRVWRS
jgi:hypothetical protein